MELALVGLVQALDGRFGCLHGRTLRGLLFTHWQVSYQLASPVFSPGSIPCSRLQPGRLQVLLCLLEVSLIWSIPREVQFDNLPLREETELLKDIMALVSCSGLPRNSSKARTVTPKSIWLQSLYCLLLYQAASAVPYPTKSHKINVCSCIFKILHWSIFDLQCCVSFRYIAEWFTYTDTYSYSLSASFPI